MAVAGRRRDGEESARERKGKLKEGYEERNEEEGEKERRKR